MSSAHLDKPGVEGYYGTIDNVELSDSLQEDAALDSYDKASAENVDGLSTSQLHAQYAEELKQIDEEIQTLRQVLLAKCRRQQFLKRQLGITVISELRNEVNRGVDTIRTSEAYQKTTAAVKNVKEKTSAALYDKWSYLKQTNAFKSFEGKLETAYSSVRMPSSFSSLALTAPSAVNKLVRSATITASHPTTHEQESTNQTPTSVSSPPQSAYSLDEKDDSPVSSPSLRGTIKLDSLDTDGLLANDQSTAEPLAASNSGAGDEPKQPGHKRRPRKKE